MDRRLESRHLRIHANTSANVGLVESETAGVLHVTTEVSNGGSIIAAYVPITEFRQHRCPRVKSGDPRMTATHQT